MRQESNLQKREAMDLTVPKPCQVCGSYTQVNVFECCEECSETEEQLLAIAREHIRRAERMRIFDLAKVLHVDPYRIYRWIKQGRLHVVLLNNGGNASTEQLRYCGPPRRVEAKWENYWTEVSLIRVHPHPRIWLSELRGKKEPSR